MNDDYEVFSRIYRDNVWGNGSGWGSSIEFAQAYVNFINEFLQSNEIKSVLDIGCGDWQFSRFIEWGKVRYVGIDVVEGVIEENKKTFLKPGVEFLRCSAEDMDMSQFELILIKDVLQHLPSERVHAVIDRVCLSGCRFCLITNDVAETPSRNADIEIGGHRDLDVSLPPFSMKCERVLRFWSKEALLWEDKKGRVTDESSEGR